MFRTNDTPTPFEVFAAESDDPPTALWRALPAGPNGPLLADLEAIYAHNLNGDWRDYYEGPYYDDPTEPTIPERLEYLRGELRAERISYGELAELQSLADHIPSGDVELLEAAGVPEHPDEED